MKRREQVEEIAKTHKEKVEVSCNDYHVHSAACGCLRGPEDSVDICILYEYILLLETKMQTIKKSFDEVYSFNEGLLPEVKDRESSFKIKIET